MWQIIPALEYSVTLFCKPALWIHNWMLHFQVQSRVWQWKEVPGCDSHTAYCGTGLQSAFSVVVQHRTLCCVWDWPIVHVVCVKVVAVLSTPVANSQYILLQPLQSSDVTLRWSIIQVFVSTIFHYASRSWVWSQTCHELGRKLAADPLRRDRLNFIKHFHQVGENIYIKKCN